MPKRKQKTLLRCLGLQPFNHMFILSSLGSVGISICSLRVHGTWSHRLHWLSRRMMMSGLKKKLRSHGKSVRRFFGKRLLAMQRRQSARELRNCTEPKCLSGCARHVTWCFLQTNRNGEELRRMRKVYTCRTKAPDYNKHIEADSFAHLHRTVIDYSWMSAMFFSNPNVK